MEVLVVPEGANEGGQPASRQPRETFTVAIPGQKFALAATIVNRSQSQDHAKFGDTADAQKLDGDDDGSTRQHAAEL